MLAYPDPQLPYVVDTDASNLAICAVLSQVQDGEKNVIMYPSQGHNDDGVRQEESSSL